MAVYVKQEHLEASVDPFRYQLCLAARIDLALPDLTVDLRPLNTAPLNFRYRVITTGSLLFSNNETERIAFLTKTRDFFFDFEPHPATSLSNSRSWKEHMTKKENEALIRLFLNQNKR